MTRPSSDLASVQTLPQLLAWRCARTPDGTACRTFDPASQAWVQLTWAQVRERVALWGRALDRLALPSGARVAILLPGGVDALCMDQATLALGHVPVPLPALDSPARLAAILADCQASLLVVDTLLQWRAVAAAAGSHALPHLRTVVVRQGGTDPDTAVAVWSLADWLGAARPRAPMHTPPCAADPAVLLYPAGGSGAPRGVVLTHRNVLAGVQALLAHLQPTVRDVFLSVLPLSEALERSAGYYLPMAAGSCVAYARSASTPMDTGLQDLRAVQPTVLVALPHTCEALQAAALQHLATTPLRQRLWDACAVVGWRRFCRDQRMPASQRALLGREASAGWWTLLPWPLLHALVVRPLQAHWGGRLRWVLTGAPLPPALARCLLGLGLPLLQGHGTPEAGGLVCANTLHDQRPASVGRALPGVELHIGDNQQLQVRGPLVMKGYWEQPTETARVLASDGWLSTGERAATVDGRLYLRSRTAPGAVPAWGASPVSKNQKT